MSVEIITGEILRWDSIAKAARSVGANVVTISNAVKNMKPSKGYVWCNPGDEQRATEMAEYLRAVEAMKAKRGRPKKKDDGMVWLQIDSHTRIRVKPEEATPEFAIKYIKRLNRANRE